MLEIQSIIYIIMYRKEIYNCFQPIYGIVINNKKNYNMILSCYKLWACYHYMMHLLFTEGTRENRVLFAGNVLHVYTSSCLTEK